MMKLRSSKRLEARVRAKAKRKGCRVTKSRQALHANNKGDYQLVTGRNNIVILGADYDATLEEIDAYLNEH